MMSESTEDFAPETADMSQFVMLGEALNRLKMNPDYKLVFEEYIMKECALGSTSLLAVPQIKAQGQRQDVIEDLIAISNLQYRLSFIQNQYETAIEDSTEEDFDEVEK